MHFRTQQLVAALFFTLGCTAAQACVCGSAQNKEDTERQIEQMRDAAPFIFLARIIKVTRTDKKPDFDQRANIEPLENFKVAPGSKRSASRIVRTSHCGRTTSACSSYRRRE